MSFWIPRRDAEGRLHFYTISVLACHVAFVSTIWAADAQLRHIDLQPQANHLLDEDFPPGHYPGDRLSELNQTATPFCVAITVEDAPRKYDAEIRKLETRLELLKADLQELKTRMDSGRLPNEPAAHRFLDDFKGKYSRAWSIRSPNPNNVSLTKRPGMLTITTEQGGIWKSFDGTKNIFLIDNPIVNGGDFVMTTRLAGFDPVTNYNQAGLICFDDADNYLKFVLQWDSNQGGRALCSLREEGGGNIHTSYISVKEKLDEVWMRIIKKGNRYVAAASCDGQHYRVIGGESWGNGRPAKVGLIAKNGAPRSAPQLDASFDFFAIAPLDDKQTLLLWDAESAPEEGK